MPPKRQPIPPTWGSYERGGRTGSTDSDLSHNHIHFDEGSEQHADGTTSGTGGAYEHGGNAERTLKPRRSSMSMRINSIRQAGGVNSIDNFARSWQRAAGFYEIAPVRQSFRHSDAGDDEFGREHVEGTPKDPRSLLRQAFQDHERNRTGGANTGEAVEEDYEDDNDAGHGSASNSKSGSSNSGTVKGENQPLIQERLSGVHDDSIFSIEPQLASPFGGSYGSTWGSLKSNLNEPAMRHAGRLFRQQQISGTTDPDKEREPLLVKQVEEDDGRVVTVVVGQSTLPQTIFNSVNVLIGVGLLALPLAMRYSGWIPGLIFFFFAAGSTSYTAKILAKCQETISKSGEFHTH